MGGNDRVGRASQQGECDLAMRQYVHQHDELPVEHVQRGVLVGRNVAHVAAVHLHEHAGHRLNQRGGHAPWLRKRGKKPPRTGVNIW